MSLIGMLAVAKVGAYTSTASTSFVKTLKLSGTYTLVEYSTGSDALHTLILINWPMLLFAMKGLLSTKTASKCQGTYMYIRTVHTNVPPTNGNIKEELCT